jgi:hypothetical protein
MHLSYKPQYAVQTQMQGFFNWNIRQALKPRQPDKQIPTIQVRVFKHFYCEANDRFCKFI